MCISTTDLSIMGKPWFHGIRNEKTLKQIVSQFKQAWIDNSEKKQGGFLFLALTIPVEMTGNLEADNKT